MRLAKQMPLAEIESKAYLIYSEWGPQRQIPRDQRLADCFPDIPEDTRRAWMKEFDQIEHAIWKAAKQADRAQVPLRRLLGK